MLFTNKVRVLLQFTLDSKLEAPKLYSVTCLTIAMYFSYTMNAWIHMK